VKGIQVCSYKEPGPLQRGDDHQKCKKKNRVQSIKNLLRNYWARKAQIYMKAS
jgi:hypothetical protein